MALDGNMQATRTRQNAGEAETCAADDRRYEHPPFRLVHSAESIPSGAFNAVFPLASCLCDFAVVTAAGMAAAAYALPVGVSPFSALGSSSAVLTALILAGALCHLGISLSMEGLGLPEIRYPWRRLALGPALAVAAIGIAWLMAGLIAGTGAIPSGWLAFWIAGAIGGLVAARAVTHALAKRLARTGHLGYRTAVVGANERGVELATGFSEQNPGLWRFAGMYDARWNRYAGGYEGVPLRGSLDTLVEEAAVGKIDKVVVALPGISEERLAEILRTLSPMPIDIYLAAGRQVEDLTGAGTTASEPPGWPVLREPLPLRARLLKSVEDMVGATLLVLISLPMMCVVAAAIKVDSRGPILFRQKRLGLGGRVFTMLKFRTMSHEQSDPNADRLTQPGDPRVTRVGRFLRRMSLDELPQLFNVVRGDMSLVGPRPLPPNFHFRGQAFAELIPSYPARLRVKPGITGWAQVSGYRGTPPNFADAYALMQKRIAYDLHYAENWSLAFDVYILLRTFWPGKAHENAF